MEASINVSFSHLRSISAAHCLPARLRAPGDPIPRHASNKRKGIGLSSIPDSVKIAALSQVPSHFKVNMFDIIVKNAFPHFDNLMMAAWNVVSLFSGTGTEENDLLRAVSQLDAVLREFDNHDTAPNKLKKNEADEDEVEIKTTHKTHTAPPHAYHAPSESSRISTPVPPRAAPTATQHSASWGARPSVPPSKQHHAFNLHPSQHPVDGYVAEDDEDEEEELLFPPNRMRSTGQYPPSAFPPSHREPRHHPYARNTVERPTPSTSLASSGYHPPYSSYDQQYQGYPHSYHPHQQHHHQLYPQPPPSPPFPSRQAPPPQPSAYPPSPYQPAPHHIRRKFSINPPPQPTPSSTHSTPGRSSRAQRPPSRQVYNTDGKGDGEEFGELDEPGRSVGVSHTTNNNNNHGSGEAATSTEQDDELNSLFEDRDASNTHQSHQPSTTALPEDGDAEMRDTHSAPMGDEIVVAVGTREDGAADDVDAGGEKGLLQQQQQSLKTPSSGIYLGRSALGKRKERSGAPVADMFGGGKDAGEGSE
ncbi:hypothetical protein DM02DRAFT_608658 [Periconia macrospinosa]|uniref:Uncharacterized protein n=1 Tax=Periconia macrospinosa TaxID=97972 RepID=A0A2V1EB26_9PLEO|nr:hypothetical protein DM02DRAFT_608658 [Periconia macrospinosa]